jgi:hypothetical protein
MGGTARFFPLRGFGDLEMPADVELPTCDHCEQVIMSPKFAAAFDEGMQRAYQSKLSEIIWMRNE